MKPQLAVALVLSVPLWPHVASAQEDASPAIQATYYYCDQSRAAAADTIVEEVLGPVFDKHVAAGHLTAWGWLGHHLGGPWRRVAYTVAPSVEVLLDTRDQVIEEIFEAQGAAIRELTAICPRHDDYIWEFVAGSQPPAELALARPTAGYSTYYECDISREARADTLMMQAVGPILDRHVGEGGFNSWGWYSHRVGGKVRRLAVFDGADHKTLMNTIGAVFAEVGEEQSAAGTEFGEICNAHEDYMWNILIARP
jgi:hypothetical protein